MASFMRITIAAAVMALAVVAGFWLLLRDQQQQAINELSRMNASLEQQVADREAMVGRLSRSRRLGLVDVLSQQEAQDGTIAWTTLRFVELDDDGSEIARQDVSVPGDVIFLDALTVKFDPSEVAAGNPLRGQTLVLLRRIYSERMAPIDGFPIDTPGAIPPGYATAPIGRYEQRIWDHFWQVATNPDLAAAMGVRVAQGEAVYKPVRAGERYELIVDAQGGMSLAPRGAQALVDAPDE